MDEVGFELKVEAFRVLWNARVFDPMALGNCLTVVEMVNGLRRTNAMLSVAFDAVNVVDDVVAGVYCTKRKSGMQWKVVRGESDTWSTKGV